MGQSLEMHLADDGERIQAFENVHEFWDGGRTLEQHLAWRLQSAQHLWADWYVGCVEGRVVTSLGAYPLRLRTVDGVCDGIAVGAVHTVPEFRGRGLAPRLLDWAERHHGEKSMRFSVLFSDIDPNFYSRLGYQVCPSWRGRWRQSAIDELQADQYSEYALREFAPLEHLDSMAACYSSWQAGLQVSIERDAGYWGYLVGKAREDRFVWLIDSAGRERGYAVYAPGLQSTGLREVVVDQRDPELTRVLLTLLAAELSNQKAGPLQGWVPRVGPFLDLFQVGDRIDEITMVKWSAAVS
ncbi:MAG: GNAT family N-acetyltransferase, partial [Planctomycetaceae bacterium]